MIEFIGVRNLIASLEIKKNKVPFPGNEVVIRKDIIEEIIAVLIDYCEHKYIISLQDSIRARDRLYADK